MVTKDKENDTVDDDTSPSYTSVTNETCDEILSDDDHEKSRKYWPCAPDGYIPNSVIRSIVQPMTPQDYSELIQVNEEEKKRDLSDGNYFR